MAQNTLFLAAAGGSARRYGGHGRREQFFLFLPHAEVSGLRL